MRFLDKLKSVKEDKKASTKENVLDMAKDTDKKDETPAETRASNKLKQDTGRAHFILKRPHLSEKTNMLSALHRYVFIVDPKSNKIEVKKAVEATFDVHVVSVNIIRNTGKVRRAGRSLGKTSDFKKAIVTLKTGEKIAGLVAGA